MKQFRITRFIFLALFSFYTSVSLGQVSEKSSWNLVNDEDGIEVFTRTSENSNVKEIRIICTVKTSMEQMTKFLSRVPLYTDWVYKCNSSLLLKQKSQSEFSYYITLDFPFPFDDRDLMVDSKHSLDPITGVYHSSSVVSKNTALPNDEFVHISEFESRWEITPQKQGMLLVDYTALSNPGGDIPVWLVNLAITKGPKETMKNFIRMVEEL
jgi:hypothetical protein